MDLLDLSWLLSEESTSVNHIPQTGSSLVERVEHLTLLVTVRPHLSNAETTLTTCIVHSINGHKSILARCASGYALIWVPEVDSTIPIRYG